MNEELKQKVATQAELIAAMQNDIVSMKQQLSLAPHFTDAITDIQATGMGYTRLNNTVHLIGKELDAVQGYAHLYTAPSAQFLTSKVAITFPTPTLITSEFTFTSPSSITVATTKKVLMVATAQLFNSSGYATDAYNDCELSIEATAPSSVIASGRGRIASSSAFSSSDATYLNITIFALIDGSQYALNPLKIYLESVASDSMNIRIDHVRFGLLEVLSA